MMHHRFVSLLVSFAALVSIVTPTHAQSVCDAVNPFIGTAGPGHTYPGAQWPFGMVQLSPDGGQGGWDRTAGYCYSDSTIASFSHTHLSGTGAGDLYDIAYLPLVAPASPLSATQLMRLAYTFSHADEQASPGFYAVTLQPQGLRVSLTATPRCGVQRYEVPDSVTTLQVVLNLARAINWDATEQSSVRQVDAQTIEGYRFSTGWAKHQKVWFRTRFSQPIAAIHLDSLDDGRGVIATLTFALRDVADSSRQQSYPMHEESDVNPLHRTEQHLRQQLLQVGATSSHQLLVLTALSPTGYEGAARNLNAEAPHFDFNRYVQSARQAWQDHLGKIEVEGGTAEQRTIFYTALYHSLLAPTLYQDVDGATLGPDGQVHRITDHAVYSTYSLWDTYRAAHPLYTLLFPQTTHDMVESLLRFSQQNGRLPVWTIGADETDMMIGYHAASVIAEAVLKGIPHLDADEALRQCVRTAQLDAYRGIGSYRRLGYVPYDAPGQMPGDDDWSLSRTLEYAYDDACIARLARHVGARRTARQFAKRAQSYRNLYNPANGFFQPKDSLDRFQPNFSPYAYTHHICESNAWPYLWAPVHEAKRLRRLMGRQQFQSRLDSFFTAPTPADVPLPIFSTGMIGQYVHGNEPSHHAAFLYRLTYTPTQADTLVHRILATCYANRPDGLCGNDDCGQLSAWAVFAAMGFYPADPTSCTYQTVTPLFPRVTLHLQHPVSGRPIDVSITHNGKSLLINGKAVRRRQFTHERLFK